MFCETVKIKATDPEQGDYVVINKEDFVEGVHELYAEPKEEKAKPEAKADAKK